MIHTVGGFAFTDGSWSCVWWTKITLWSTLFFLNNPLTHQELWQNCTRNQMETIIRIKHAWKMKYAKKIVRPLHTIGFLVFDSVHKLFLWLFKQLIWLGVYLNVKANNNILLWFCGYQRKINGKFSREFIKKKTF